MYFTLLCVCDLHSSLFVMPGYSEGDNGLGAKIVTMYPGNTEKGLPSHNALILLFHPETGIPQAVSVQLCPLRSLVYQIFVLWFCRLWKEKRSLL